MLTSRFHALKLILWRHNNIKTCEPKSFELVNHAHFFFLVNHGWHSSIGHNSLQLKEK